MLEGGGLVVNCNIRYSGSYGSPAEPKLPVLLIQDDACGCVHRHVRGHFPDGAVLNYPSSKKQVYITEENLIR
jgi:hypothetical protein